MPYWNEPADAATFPDVAVFDPKTGFGGNGSSTDHCVTDGPFANLTLRVNRDLTTSDHCLTRNFNTCSFKFAVQANVDECQNKTTWQTWRTCTEAIPHASGHGGVGALMQSVPLSPGDPIFWLHHTYLDKLWHDWQQVDPSTRTYAIGGTNQFLTDPALQGGDNGALFLVENGTMNVFMPPGANQTKIIASYCGVFQPNIVFPTQPQFVNYFGDGGNVTTLNHTLSTLGLYPNATANDVMDLGGDFICAEYV
jgi:tyrosinase